MRFLRSSLEILRTEAQRLDARAPRVAEIRTLLSELATMQVKLDTDQKLAWLRNARQLTMRQLTDLRRERQTTQQFNLVVAYQTLIDQLDDYIYFRNFE